MINHLGSLGFYIGGAVLLAFAVKLLILVGVYKLGYWSGYQAARNRTDEDYWKE